MGRALQQRAARHVAIGRPFCRPARACDLRLARLALRLLALLLRPALDELQVLSGQSHALCLLLARPRAHGGTRTREAFGPRPRHHNGSTRVHQTSARPPPPPCRASTPSTACWKARAWCGCGAALLADGRSAAAAAARPVNGQGNLGKTQAKTKSKTTREVESYRKTRETLHLTLCTLF